MWLSHCGREMLMSLSDWLSRSNIGPEMLMSLSDWLRRLSRSNIGPEMLMSLSDWLSRLRGGDDDGCASHGTPAGSLGYIPQ